MGLLSGMNASVKEVIADAQERYRSARCTNCVHFNTSTLMCQLNPQPVDHAEDFDDYRCSHHPDRQLFD